MCDHSVIPTEQSHSGDIPVWKNNRGPLQNQAGMSSFFSYITITRITSKLYNER